MEEVWKDVPGYEGHYQVSNLGRVKSVKRIGITKKGDHFNIKERILKTIMSTKGYLTLSLCLKGIKKTHQIHQLVAIAFLEHKPNGHEMVCNHKNFIRTDNRVENLEIVTNRENTNKKHLKSNSKYTGVFKVERKIKHNKWRSIIVVNNKLKHLGYFNTEIEASLAYENELYRITKAMEINK